VTLPPSRRNFLLHVPAGLGLLAGLQRPQTNGTDQAVYRGLLTLETSHVLFELHLLDQGLLPRLLQRPGDNPPSCCRARRAAGQGALLAYRRTVACLRALLLARSLSPPWGDLERSLAGVRAVTYPGAPVALQREQVVDRVFVNARCSLTRGRLVWRCASVGDCFATGDLTAAADRILSWVGWLRGSERGLPDVVAALPGLLQGRALHTIRESVASFLTCAAAGLLASNDFCRLPRLAVLSEIEAGWRNFIAGQLLDVLYQKVLVLRFLRRPKNSLTGEAKYKAPPAIVPAQWRVFE
jgi:hypothetical protein